MSWFAIGGLAACVLSTPMIADAQTAYTDSTATESPLQRAARAATAGVPFELPDTLAQAPVGIRFKPMYLNSMFGDVNFVGMKNSFQTNMTTSFGSVFNFLISNDEKHYRLQDKRDENKQLSGTLLHTFNIFSSGSLSYLDSRVFNRSIIPGGAVQDYIFNDKSLTAGGTYKRTYRPHFGYFNSIRVDGTGSGAAVRGEKTYKDDQTVALGGFGGLSTELRRKSLRLDGRGGHRETWDRSETALAEFNDLGSAEDSLFTGVLAEVADSIFVDATYVFYDGERTWADQAQGSQGSQQGGVQNVFQETERRATRATVISLKARVWNRFRIELKGSHDSQLNDYVIQKTRYSNTVADGLVGTFAYKTPWNTAAVVTLENTETLRDFGPLSVSSYNDIRKKAGIALTHTFRPEFTIALAGNTMLTRSEYLDPVANPRDRDQVDTSVNLQINSTPFTDFVARVSIAYSASEYLNIDASQSEDNRTRELYEFRPGFTYYFSDRFIIEQQYGIQIEYNDYVYKATQNFLDRSLTFGNKFIFKPTPRVGFIFDYAYTFHDKGSYLPDEVTGEDELSVQSEDRRDRINLRVNYDVMSRTKTVNGQTVNDGIKIFGEQRYGRFEDRSLLTDNTSVNTDGQLAVGTQGNFDWGGGRTLTFTLARVKKDSRFGSEKEKNYWDMRSEFNYSF